MIVLKSSDFSMDGMREALFERGYAYVQNIPLNFLQTILANSHILNHADVRPCVNHKSLTNSFKALKLHTDHHCAEYVILHCIRPSSNGGATIMADARDAFTSLPQSDQEILHSVSFYEHKIFSDDTGIHPFISQDKNKELQFYFTFWLAPDFNSIQKDAVELFEKALEIQKHSFTLAAGDMLIFNNRWMAHGRLGFSGDRLLKRYWLNNCHFY